jgi:hypothetical protein
VIEKGGSLMYPHVTQLESRKYRFDDYLTLLVESRAERATRRVRLFARLRLLVGAQRVALDDCP